MNVVFVMVMDHLVKLFIRLGDQLDVKTRAIVNLKQEVSARDEMIKSCQEKLLKHSNSQLTLLTTHPAHSSSVPLTS